MTRYISVADTAKLLRKALKSAFPSIKFSVRSSSYSGGASITVRWVDGATVKEVEQVGRKFAGATFDGMQDLKSYVTHEVDGEKLSYGADFVFCERAYTAPFLTKVAAMVGEKYGVAPVAVVVTEWGGAHVDTSDLRHVAGDYLWMHTNREAYQIPA